MPDDTKKCPMCAEDIKAEANVCRYCGAEFDKQNEIQTAEPPAVPIPPAPRQEPQPKKSRRGLTILLLIFSALVLAVCGACVAFSYFGGANLTKIAKSTVEKDMSKYVESADLASGVKNIEAGTVELNVLDTLKGDEAYCRLVVVIFKNNSKYYFIYNEMASLEKEDPIVRVQKFNVETQGLTNIKG